MSQGWECFVWRSRIRGVCPWQGGSPYILRAGHIWGSRLAHVDGSLSSPSSNDSWCRKKWPCNGHSMLGKRMEMKADLFRFSYSHWGTGIAVLELPSAGQLEHAHRGLFLFCFVGEECHLDKILIMINRDLI